MTPTKNPRPVRVLFALHRLAAWSWAAVLWAITLELAWDGCTSAKLTTEFRIKTFVGALIFAAIGFAPVALENRLRRPTPGLLKSALILFLTLFLLLGAFAAGTLCVAIIERMAGGTPVFG